MSLTADDTPRGFDYQPGLALLPDGDPDVEDWRAYALCQGLHDTYDLAEEVGMGRPTNRLRKENEYKLHAARRICFECPVFETCWNQAYDTLPQGVIQAGAKLSNAAAEVRKQRLMSAWALYVHHRRLEERRLKREQIRARAEQRRRKQYRPDRHGGVGRQRRTGAGTGPAPTGPGPGQKNVRPGVRPS